MKPIARLLLAGLALGVLALVSWQLRIIEVQGRPVIAWAWQDAQVSFTNSVTRRPVLIKFDLRRDFSDFQMITDFDTEGYYTGGEYRINDRLKGQQERTLQYCSVVGMQLRIGEQQWNIKQSCLTAKLLWPPGSGG
ncbi:hypothetical protein GCM10010840_31910 [Deinococcus aerolatus]|uniref:DUF2850 domain-containing protein n=1 Tax=Deinococcus aerolatus TaxID=522487 RepID=A0ABQ2GF03_9DEIO|nr:hypothetical protein [Deinococcus aerolatus]GGL91428.1 hypothetical protein GCM10010840_31910 [Deinococcus aerolatus]